MILSFWVSRLTPVNSTGAAPNENDGYYEDRPGEAMVDDDVIDGEDSKSEEEVDGEDLDENLEK